MANRGKQTRSKPDPKKAPKKEGPQRRLSPNESPKSSGILDQGTKRDISGVAFIVAGVVLELLAILTSNGAVLSGIASKALHLAFGMGSYILPVLLIALGIAFIRKPPGRHIQLRAAMGFLVIFIALLGLISLFAPITILGKDDLGLLFSEYSLMGYGGYIGSSIAYVGIMLLGRLISAVILLGVMLIGALIVGLPFSRLVDSVRGRRYGRADTVYGSRQSAAGSNGFARIRRYDDKDMRASSYIDQLQFAQSDPAFDPDITTPVGMRNLEDFHAHQAGHSMASPVADMGYADTHLMHPPGDTEGDAETRALDDRGGVRLDMDELPLPPDATRRLREHGEGQKASRQPVCIQDADPSMLRPLRKKGVGTEDDSCGQGESKPRSVPSPDSRTSPKAGKGTVCASPSPRPQEGFELPSMSLLNVSEHAGDSLRSKDELEGTAVLLHDALYSFGVDAEVVDWVAGPTVTLFEVDLAPGVKVSKITNLTNDIALALAAPGVRIFAPVPGTNYVGIEVPNAKRESVYLADVLKDAQGGPLQIAIGKDVEGNSIISDLAKMPHLLIGGTTGSGKSVAINAMIMSILMRATPSEVRFIMIDPKRVEFTPYNGIPHLYAPVVTEPKEAASALAWGVAEMERRLKIFSKMGARNISQYNAKVHELSESAADAEVDDAAQEDGDGKVRKGAFSQAAEEPLEEMPYIVIIIDELADLMMNIGKEVELSISRIAQLARAAGIHLIVATQRPSTNVVTGLIKANITNRIAFNVASGIDSRVILDTPGAENLIGLGDLLLSKPELAKPLRIQGCFVSEDEINKVVEVIRDQSAPEYHSEILQADVYTQGSTDPNGGSSGGDLDPLVWEAADITVSSKMGSTSNIQRRLKVGYARAGRIMDQLEELGVVGPANGSKPREVLVDEMELESIKAFEEND